jgi:hypothetical protein
MHSSSSEEARWSATVCLHAPSDAQHDDRLVRLVCSAGERDAPGSIYKLQSAIALADHPALAFRAVRDRVLADPAFVDRLGGQLVARVSREPDGV